MNLLRDKREQERSGEFQDFPNFSLDNFDQNVSAQAPFDKDKNRRNSSLLILFSAVVVFLSITAAGYYFGVFKPKQRTELPKQVSTAGEIKAPAESSTPKKMPSETTEPSQQIAPIERPVVVETPQTSIGMAAKILAILNNVAKENSRIGSVFMDEGSFSAEITSASLESAKATYNALLTSIPSGVKITSSPPVAGSGILLAGTFNAAVGNVAAEQLTGADLENKMRSLAQQSSLTLATTTISTQTPRQLFVKLSGGLNGCQTYLNLLAGENFKVTVSKIILMPGQSGDYTFVVRLLI